MHRFFIPALLLVIAQPVSAVSFPDTGNSAFDREIGLLKDSGTVEGYADGTFRPAQRINRAEFVKMILLEEGYGTDPGEHGRCFADFQDGDPEWYYVYACAAKDYGYVQGYPDGTFGGERTIILAEALKIVMSARGIPLPQYIQKPDHWYDPYFIAADELSLFPALPRDPSHQVTRAEMAYLLAHIELQRPPKPKGTSASSFLLHETGYECSQEIDGEWREAGIGPMESPGWYFYPSDQEAFEKFCRQSYVIEYQAVLDILRREDVRRTISKHGTVEAWVKALSHTYINDKQYLARILPAYSDVKIDCIIVVHSPEGTRFFIENGDKHESHADHRYLEVPAEEFLASLNQASDEDVTNFWLGLH